MPLKILYNEKWRVSAGVMVINQIVILLLFLLRFLKLLTVVAGRTVAIVVVK